METIDLVSKPSMPHSVADPNSGGLQNCRLDDNLTCDRGRILISGTQALVRLTLMQARLDRARGFGRVREKSMVQMRERIESWIQSK